MYFEGHGLISNPLDRLGYSIPEDVGMNSEKLKKIDSLATKVLREKMAPGLQILVAETEK